VLAAGYEGKPFEALRDLAVDRRGGVYITDGRPAPTRSVIYYIDASARITVASNGVGAANGVLLSPDEKTLYVSDTPSEYIVAFDVPREGTITRMRNFGRLEGGDRRGADGLAIDEAGRLYAATPVGVQVFSPQGEHLGTIPTPRPATSVAFAGPRKASLYIVGRGNDGPDGASQWARSIYRVAMTARGFEGRAK
jgi:gluconolactonase